MKTLNRLIFLLSLFAISKAYAQGPSMQVHIINVGQGSATLIEFPCGAILIDTGGEKNEAFESSDALTNYLDDFFARRTDLNNTIDLLIISHPHIDHTRGVKDIVSKYTLKNVVTNGQHTGSGSAGQTYLHKLIASREDTPGTSDDIGYFESVMSAIPAGGKINNVIDPINCAGADPVIRILGGKTLQDPGWGKENGTPNFDDENNHSVVCKIEFGQASILLTGDLETPAITSLLKHHAALNGVLDSDVYLVGHHGSKNGTSSDFLKAVTPEIAVLSFGDPSRKLPFTAWDYGHPNKMIVQLLSENVSRSRSTKNVMVGNGKHKFKMQPVSKALYGVGWDNSILLKSGLDGKWSLGTDANNKIDLNNATLEQLLSLPTIGQTRAQAIIDHRNNHAFTSLDELDDVPGIGPATITLLRPLVRI